MLSTMAYSSVHYNSKVVTAVVCWDRLKHVNNVPHRWPNDPCLLIQHPKFLDEVNGGWKLDEHALHGTQDNEGNPCRCDCHPEVAGLHEYIDKVNQRNINVRRDVACGAVQGREADRLLCSLAES